MDGTNGISLHFWTYDLVSIFAMLGFMPTAFLSAIFYRPTNTTVNICMLQVTVPTKFAWQKKTKLEQHLSWILHLMFPSVEQNFKLAQTLATEKVADDKEIGVFSSCFMVWSSTAFNQTSQSSPLFAVFCIGTDCNRMDNFIVAGSIMAVSHGIITTYFVSYTEKVNQVSNDVQRRNVSLQWFKFTSNTTGFNNRQLHWTELYQT